MKHKQYEQYEEHEENTTGQDGEYKEYQSDIAAVKHVTETELAVILPDYQADWIDTNVKQLEEGLWYYGLDTTRSYEVQGLNWYVIPGSGDHTYCARYYGHERGDQEWLDSGYASIEALDRAKDSQMLDDLYSTKKMTHKCQRDLEYKDSFQVYKAPVQPVDEPDGFTPHRASVSYTRGIREQEDYEVQQYLRNE